VYVAGARPCWQLPGSAEWAGDPCCNPSLLQCCVPADAQVNQIAVPSSAVRPFHSLAFSELTV
jgi:hypothetical protein